MVAMPSKPKQKKILPTPAASVPRARRLRPDPKRPTRRYSDVERAEALAVLMANGGNLRQTSRQLKIPLTTLKQWAKDQTSPVPRAELVAAVESLDTRLERYILEGLSLHPSQFQGLNFRDYTDGISKLIEKLAALRGLAGTTLGMYGATTSLNVSVAADGTVQPGELTQLSAAELNSMMKLLDKIQKRDDVVYMPGPGDPGYVPAFADEASIPPTNPEEIP